MAPERTPFAPPPGSTLGKLSRAATTLFHIYYVQVWRPIFQTMDDSDCQDWMVQREDVYFLLHQAVMLRIRCCEELTGSGGNE